MAIDPLKKVPINRGEQFKVEAPAQEKGKGVRLYDVDLAIAEHMIDTVVPSVEEFREKIKVPVMYGNPERWKSIQKDGYLRDKKGVIQIPLIMFKRNSIERNDTMASSMNRHVSYPSVSKYSKKHKYDKVFILMPWKDIYIQDNERYETFEQASEIHEYLIKWYTSFNYELVEVPQSTLENRVDFILNNI